MGELFFSQVDALVRKAKTRGITDADIPEFPIELEAGYEEHFPQKSILASPRCLLKYTIHINKNEIIAIAVLSAITILCNAFLPLVVKEFAGTLAIPTTIWPLGAIWALALILLSLARAVLGNQAFFKAMRAHARTTFFLQKMTFHSAFTSTYQQRNKLSAGEMIQLTRTDIFGIAEIPHAVSILLTNLVSSAILLAILSNILGWIAVPAAIGLGLLIFLIRACGALMTANAIKIRTLQNQRINLLTKVIETIRAIKYQNLEDHYLENICSIREGEALELRRRSSLLAINSLIGASADTLVLALCIAIWVILGNPVHIELLLPAILTFRLLGGAMGELAGSFATLSKDRAGWINIYNFLRARIDNPQESKKYSSTNNVSIEVVNLSAAFSPNQEPVINDISCEVTAGELVGITGVMGSGKSAFLKALAGEIESVSGSVYYAKGKSIGYLPQQPWVFNSTIAENILLGKELDLMRLIRVAALEKDFSNIGCLDRLAGEGGCNLSGGQRQRVALARLAGISPDIILLDDPFSGLDIESAQKVLSELILQEWRSKTRVVVTHDAMLLSKCSKILFFADGKLRDIGTAAQLSKRCFEFKCWMDEQKTITTNMDMAVDAQRETLTTEEKSVEGRVKWGVLRKYLAAVTDRSLFWYVTLPLITLAPFAFQVIQETWLALWAAPSTDRGWMGTFFSKLVIAYPDTELTVYLLLGIYAILSCLLSGLVWGIRMAAAGDSIHRTSIERVLKAPFSFFDGQHSGRIINRFSADQSDIDLKVGPSIEMILAATMRCLMAIVMMLLAIPVCIFILPIVGLYFWNIFFGYTEIARSVRRSRAVALSPVVSLLRDTVAGHADVHSHSQEFFLNKYVDLCRNQLRLFMVFVTVNRWLAVRIPLAATLLALGFSLLLAACSSWGWISLGLAGLAFVHVITLVDNLGFVVRGWGALEQSLIGVERVTEFFALEDEHGDSATASSASFCGDIKYKSVSLMYKGSVNPVIDDASFIIPAGALVLVTGPTGQGKSTLLHSILGAITPTSGAIHFRIHDPNLDAEHTAAKDEGFDRNSSTWKLTSPYSVRSNVSYLSQENCFVPGSLRFNLDPQEERSTEEILEVLDGLGLKHTIQSQLQQLDTEIYSCQLSHAEMRLLGVARALLLGRIFLLIDEGLAGVDPVSANKVINYLSKQRGQRTIIFVTHRYISEVKGDLHIYVAGGKVHLNPSLLGYAW